jgi:hypothetical protein
VIDIEGAAGMAALLVPFAVLLFVAIRAHRMPHAAPAVGRPLSVLGPPVEGILIAKDGATAEPPKPQKRLPANKTAKPEAIDWPARIGAAEAANDQAGLAALYLAFARDEIAGGRTEPAGDHLRQSIRFAARSKTAAVQAEARLELAELARAAGDLTTACEHWQIARALFHDLKQKDELGATEHLMQKHGCPTDWVLNDF